MRTKMGLWFIWISALTACNNNRVQQQPVVETPKTLESTGPSNNLISKRGPEDLVESLYGELVGQDARLKKLEVKLDALGHDKSDSTDSFYQFDQKNHSYYKAASQHIDTIGDSLLRDKLKAMVERHLANYNATTAGYNELLRAIEAKTTRLDDLHTLLKIIKTLPLMATYQKEHLPGTLPLEGYSKKQDEAIGSVSKLVQQ